MTASRKTWLPYLAILALLAASVVVVTILVRSARAERARWETTRAWICRHLATDLDRIANARSVSEVHCRMRYHQLDYDLIDLCLDGAYPSKRADAASWCWINTRQEDCYRDLASELLQLYRQRGFE